MNLADQAPPVDALLQMHQDAFNMVTEGALWVDMTGKVHYGNESAAKILGYTSKALQRTSYFEINPHFSMLGWKRFWNRLQDSTSEYFDTEFVNGDGKLFSVRGRAGFDIYSIDPELCLIVFTATEAGKRDADLLEAVQEDANMGGWEINFTTNQVYLSPPISRWLGLAEERRFYPAAEFLGIFREHVVGDIYDDVRALYKRLKVTSGVEEVPLALRAPGTDQQTAPTDYIVRARSVENELEVYKIYGTLVRAGENNAQPVKRPLQEDLLRLALDQQSESVFLISYSERKILYANDRAAEMTGFSKRELLDAPTSKIADPERVEEFGRLYPKLRDQRYLEFPTQIRRKDGSTLRTLARLHYYRRGEEEYMIAINQDNSRHEQYSENLQLHATTLDALDEWVIWLDANNGVVLVNEAARRKLSRKTSLELEGMPIEDLMPDLDIPALADIRQDKIDGRSRSATDYIYTTTSGDDRTLQVRFAQVEAGNQRFLCLICRDVTVQYNNRRKLMKTKRRVDELTKQLQSENETLREQIEQVNTGGAIITVSKKYQRILAQIAQVADTDATVLVTGETGTGKELLAQSIHKFSNRGRKPLVSVNCAALPENLIESELFGHERGAFTGAFAQKKGKFELADGGTIFLDEIGELPLDMQAKLLRVLQEGEIQRIGSTSSIHVDVRVVAATNRDLEDMISQGTFREDLFYRLNVFPIHNPPLRERTEDIPVLVKHFAKVYSDRMGRNITHINPKDLDVLVKYEFPGNVRELINLVERAVITSQSSTLNLSASLRALRRNDRNDENLSFRSDKIVPFETMQKQYIIEALKRTKGKVTGPGGAAELLDLNGRTLMSKMNKLGIDRNKFTG
ncbi:sigma 54-interacting transcriptional regulator [Neolewinella litorea]|uniref:PAS domain S-box protein n=1 Tax=Neolewinella litorea TaxID=2562452 RepID=A0A4S4NJM9_9BACT|nr:sigma 54-interacting transcriptional regulator [Neolewinella litorea]THH39979.1 PAS domain S-box protein [Neolewinella litorea]